MQIYQFDQWALPRVACELLYMSEWEDVMQLGWGWGRKEQRQERERANMCVMRFWGCRLERWRSDTQQCHACVCACPKKMLLKVDQLHWCVTKEGRDVLTCLCLGKRSRFGSQFPLLGLPGCLKLRQLGCQTWRWFRVGWFNPTIVHKYLLRL